MTRDDRAFERTLHDWLADEAPAEAPDAILDAVTARIDDLAPAHRGTWWHSGLRVAASAAVVAAVVIGAWVAGSGVRTPGASPTPLPTSTARPADIPTDGTCEEGFECLGLLEPGPHATTLFTPAMTFRIPARWENLQQSVGYMDLRPVDRPGDAVEFDALPRPRNGDGSYALGVGTSAEAFATWLASRPDLETSGVLRIAVAGRSVPYVEFTVRAGEERGLTGCPGSPCVAIASGLDPRERPTWGWDLVAGRGGAYRVYIVGDGENRYLIAVVAWSAAERQQLFAEADAIIASLSPVGR